MMIIFFADCALPLFLQYYQYFALFRHSIHAMACDHCENDGQRHIRVPLVQRRIFDHVLRHSTHIFWIKFKYKFILFETLFMK